MTIWGGHRRAEDSEKQVTHKRTVTNHRASDNNIPVIGQTLALVIPYFLASMGRGVSILKRDKCGSIFYWAVSTDQVPTINIL